MNRTIALGLALLLASTSQAADGPFFDCPCVAHGWGASGIEVRFGVENLQPRLSGALRLNVYAVYGSTRRLLGRGEFAGSGLLAHARQRFSVWVPAAADYGLDLRIGHSIEMDLEEYAGGGFGLRDELVMDGLVYPNLPFVARNIDYLEDSDRDGVGDLDEARMGTDPEDEESTPGDSEIDLLAFYSQSVPGIYDGDALTRILHAVSQTNESLRNSGVPIDVRLVGAMPIEIDESSSAPPDPDVLIREGERHGADVLALFRPAHKGIDCGWALNPGWLRDGHIPFTLLQQTNPAYVGVECPNDVLVHELGHVMGLSHSFWQNEVGTWRWARGLGVEDDFQTVMSYGRGRDIRTYLFANPSLTCEGAKELPTPCGIKRWEPAGADAVSSLRVTRFQVSQYRRGLPDSDGDGFVDAVDAFAAQSGEWADADGDGIGDNADPDDDNDGVTDGDDAFPHDPDESSDSDGDGIGDSADSFPHDATESADGDGDGTGDNADEDDDNDGVNDADDLFPNDPARDDLRSWVLRASQAGARLGTAIAVAGDIDDDGKPELLLGMPHRDRPDAEDAGAVHVVLGADLAAMDALDGVSDRVIDVGRAEGRFGYLLLGGEAGDLSGASVTAADVDGDDVPDIVIGAPNRTVGSPGKVYVVSGARLDAIDAADGERDRVVKLSMVAAGIDSWELRGGPRDHIGVAVSTGDVNRDGRADLLIGATEPSGGWPFRGGAWYIASSNLTAADEADTRADGIVEFDRAHERRLATVFRGPDEGSRAGRSVSLGGDFDGDGRADAVIGAWHASKGRGAVYVVPATRLAAADALDGSEDGAVLLAESALGAYAIIALGRPRTGLTVTAGADFTGDGRSDLLVRDASRVYVLPGSALDALDAADGLSDGAIFVGHRESTPAESGWAVGGIFHRGFGASLAVGQGTGGDAAELLTGADFVGTVALIRGVALPSEVGGLRIDWADPAPHWSFLSPDRRGQGAHAVAFADDLDGDGSHEVAFGVPLEDVACDDCGAVYIVQRDDLSGADRADGRVDQRVRLHNLAGDFDGDGRPNSKDPDDDNDGVPDDEDADPLDPEVS